jgi:hypothetical protein
MQKCVINGEVYWLYGGQWVPRRHFYDHGEEPIYIGRRRRPAARPSIFGFMVWCVVGGYFILAKLIWHVV